MTSRELLAAVRKARGYPSNYALARELGFTDNTVTRWNVGSNTPDDLTAARLAELAGLDPDAVVASMHAQRAHEPAERQLWARIAERLAAPAVLALLALGVGFGFDGGPDGGAQTQLATAPLYLMSTVAAVALAAFLALKRAGATIPAMVFTRASLELAACR